MLGIVLTEPARCLRNAIALALVLATFAPGCSAYRHYEDSKPANVRKTEAMLADAGFTTIKLDSDDKVGLVEDLPADELYTYKTESGPVYWYYDPDVCNCVYEGHKPEYDRYQLALQHEGDVAQYAAQSEDQEIAQLNALNGGFFPPPLFWVGGVVPVAHYGGGGGGGHWGGGRGFGGGGHGGGGGGHGR